MVPSLSLTTVATRFGAYPTKVNKRCNLQSTFRKRHHPGPSGSRARSSLLLNLGESDFCAQNPVYLFLAFDDCFDGPDQRGTTPVFFDRHPSAAQKSAILPSFSPDKNEGIVPRLSCHGTAQHLSKRQ